MIKRGGAVTTTTIDMGTYTPDGFPPVTVFDVFGDIILSTVHDAKLCAGELCPFHNPSDHHMKDWPMTFNSPMLYRYCQHGYEHPDPDALDYARRNKLNTDPHHRELCDGCCCPPR